MADRVDEPMRDLSEDFYRCPSTGNLIYNWHEERYVLLHEDALRSLQEELDAQRTVIQNVRDWTNEAVAEPPELSEHRKGVIAGYCLAKEQVAEIIDAPSTEGREGDAT